jgi:hypothetical protein
MASTSPSRIPDEAVEAAFRAIVGGNEVTGPDIAGDFLTTEQITAILEAAAPHLMAAAWDAGYEAKDSEYPFGPRYSNPYRKYAL